MSMKRLNCILKEKNIQNKTFLKDKTRQQGIRDWIQISTHKKKIDFYLKLFQKKNYLILLQKFQQNNFSRALKI